MNRYNWIFESLGEIAGTFILVFFGTGVVHSAVLTQAQSGLWQVAIVWGSAVALAIYAVAAVSGAHINPAITIAFAFRRGFPVRKIPHYLVSQLLGAILAAAVLYMIFSGPLLVFEQSNNIIRGQPGSELSAMVYGEYFPNPAVAKSLGWSEDCISPTVAFLSELIGTGLLAFFVFALTDTRNSTPKGAQAVSIGLGLACLISVIAPLTQACFNPARDFGPRLIAYAAGWKSIAIPGPRGGFLTVYILAPVVGAVTGAYLCDVLIGLGIKNKFQENNMKSVKLLLIGGFLGSGKTTLLYQAATQLIKSGKRVGLITNDQAPELVDTQMLSSSGLAVSEVAGSCFCCNFKGLIDAAETLCQKSDKDNIDILLAEPVGSCTDLSATIVQPIKDRYMDVFSIGPLSVLIDPVRATEVLAEKQSLLHPGAAYIYRKQLEEADRIIVNKSDLLDTEARQQLKTLLQNEFPGKNISFISCKTGEGINDWLKQAIVEQDSGKCILDINYDTYAEGEAVLGWLNARFELTCDKEIDWAEFGRKYLELLQGQFQSKGAQVGHVKLFLSTGKENLTANLTANDGPVLIQKGQTDIKTTQAEMTLNARVQMEPGLLQKTSIDALMNCSSDVTIATHSIRCLRPERPQPTYRYANRI